ncbi:hypothetical protein NKJ74_27185 [Mesorhizobium sp. M0046]|uniref:hypothetical protein n=1 Tax=Mesorhizobium sp. M0046 TaxID=2956858 RepID=UPI003339CB4C
MLKILDQIYAFSPWRQRSDDTGAGQARPLQLQACLPGAHGVDDFAHRVEDELPTIRMRISNSGSIEGRPTGQAAP